MAITMLLHSLGGAAYVTAATAHRLMQSGRATLVADAPVIPQTVYAATSLRTRHAHQHRKIIGAMEALLSAGNEAEN
ncbi:hypothetical protein D3C87_1990790 [compost metagenome]